MSNISIASLRLGKTSVEAIKDLYQTQAGLTEPFKISVTCTQVPQELEIGMYVFIWLGSDNSKGIPTAWKQGYKAFGRVTALNRGASYNDESTTEVEILYAFGESVNRLDFLKLAPEAYYDCSGLPIIGLDDHSNQTIRLLQDNGERFDIGAMLYALNTIDKTLKPSLIKIDERFQSLFSYLPPSLKTSSTKSSHQSQGFPRQIIYYGAPGTGKSHKIKSEIKVHSHLRTTFHPDSDYSTFVGAYKPKMEPTLLRDLSGHRVKDEKTGNELWSKQIVYDFVPQAFLKAYLKAWEIYPKKQYLIIEEINRGNCAQIFGDLFQLLDRNSSYFSDYPIAADEDLQNYIKDHINVNGIGENEIEKINDLYSDEYENIFSAIAKGEMLLLPSNLYIWATMNTSDQSLFPIDSAFKRRWDWKYIPICDAGKAWMVKVDGVDYDWWDFVKKINQKIWDATHSEDKKLGYFFCKADEQGVVSADKFVGKVLFYVYNDVFKDYGLDDAIFKDEDGSELLFHKYFNPDGTANEKKIRRLLDNMEVKVVGSDVDNDEDKEPVE